MKYNEYKDWLGDRKDTMGARKEYNSTHKDPDDDARRQANLEWNLGSNWRDIYDYDSHSYKPGYSAADGTGRFSQISQGYDPGGRPGASNNRGNSYGSSFSSSAYREYQEALAAQKAAAEAAQKAKIDAAVSKLEGQRPSIYQNAEAAAQQAYINKMLAQRDMAQQMTASGLSGGLSDSALIAMNSDYENSRNSILQNQSNALNELNTNINQVKAGGDLSLAEMQSQYQAALAQQAAQELQRQQELQNQMDLLAYKAQLEREAAAQAAGISAGGAMRQYSGQTYGGNTAGNEVSSSGATQGDTANGNPVYTAALRNLLRMEYGRTSGAVGEANAQDFVIQRVQNAYKSGQISLADAQAILRDYGMTGVLA